MFVTLSYSESNKGVRINNLEPRNQNRAAILSFLAEMKSIVSEGKINKQTPRLTFLCLRHQKKHNPGTKDLHTHCPSCSHLTLQFFSPKPAINLELAPNNAPKMLLILSQPASLKDHGEIVTHTHTKEVQLRELTSKSPPSLHTFAIKKIK